MIDNEFIEESTPVFTGDSDSKEITAQVSTSAVTDNVARPATETVRSGADTTGQAPTRQTPITAPDQLSEPPAELIEQDSASNWDEEKTIIVGAVAETESRVLLVNMANDQKTELTGYPFVIGRHRSCDLQLSHKSVSRRHAVISRQDDDTGYFLEDAGSANGTLLNDVRTDKVILNSGDKLQLGEVVFTFTVIEQKPVNDALSSSLKLPSFNLSKLKALTIGGKSSSSGLTGKLAALKQGLRASTKKKKSPAAQTAASSVELDSLAGQDLDETTDTIVIHDAAELSDSGTKFSAVKKQVLERVGGSRYPLIAAVAAVVLAGAYFLSPARRVVVIDATPVASTPATAANNEDAVVQDEPDAAQVPINDSEAATATAQNEKRSDQISNELTAGNTDNASGAKVEPSEVNDNLSSSNKSTASETANNEPVAQQVAVLDARSIATAEAVSTMTTNASNQTASETVGKTDDVSNVAASGGGSATIDNKGELVAQKMQPQVIESSSEPKPKAVIRRSPRWSRGYINNSLAMYVAGDVDNAVKRLGILSRSARHQKRFRDESAGLAGSLNELYAQYVSGRNLLDQGQEDAAFTTWRNYLLQEKRMFPQRESVFARGIKDEVVRVYTRRGNSAYAAGDPGGAYDAWQQASSISPNGEAAVALQDLQTRAKERFIEGYRQESVNIRTAMAMWQDVVALVPPHNEYHIKAKAKLRLYKSYGAQ